MNHWYNIITRCTEYTYVDATIYIYLIWLIERQGLITILKDKGCLPQANTTIKLLTAIGIQGIEAISTWNIHMYMYASSYIASGYEYITTNKQLPAENTRQYNKI